MDKYEKIRIVGRGAYGIVHLCSRLSDKKMVIIKQIPVEQMTRDERQAALNEVKVLSMLSHPNIIEYYENFLEDKALMIVMEYAEGGTLFDFIQQRGENLLEEHEIMSFFAQMLLSLQHVHSKQILHRDLKTQNILLDKKREVIKIGDFGISKVLSSKSKAISVVGTPCYISPELCEGKPYNQKSDIWALGCVLYELTTLKRAFEAASLPALILKIMRGTIGSIAEHFSEELGELILSTLHLDPNKRPSINQIMATPSVMNAILNLYTDFGKVPCRRAPRPLSNFQTRNRVQRNPSSSNKGPCLESIPTEGSLHNKPSCLCHVYCWGSGIATPTRMPLPSSETLITQVAMGRTHKVAVTKNGRLFIWEAPTVSVERGVEGLSSSFIPRYLEGQSAVSIAHVACGDLFTACLTDRGILMTFGSGANGCLGHGNFQDVSQAKIVEKLLGFEVSHVACGMSHVVAVTNEHEVFTWGIGDNGRLGVGNSVTTCTPTQAEIGEEHQPVQVFCGADNSVILTAEGQLLCAGSNRCNKLALDEPTRTVDEVEVFTPVMSPPLHKMQIKSVALGGSHSVVITEKNDVYSFGANQFGQLGHGSDAPDSMPHKVMALSDIHVSTVACGDRFTTVVSRDAQVYTWGKSSRGRLGRSETSTNLPKKVQFHEEEPFLVTSATCSHGSTLVATKSKCFRSTVFKQPYPELDHFLDKHYRHETQVVNYSR